MPTQSNMDPMDRCIYRAKNNYLHSFKVDLFPSLFRRFFDVQKCFSQSSIAMFQILPAWTSTPPKANMDTQNGNLWKEIHVKNTSFFVSMSEFRGGVGLIASFDLNNHQASSCCSMRRLRHAATAAWFQGAKKTPWLRYGYLSQAGGRTGRSTLKPYFEVQDTGCNWLCLGVYDPRIWGHITHL